MPNSGAKRLNPNNIEGLIYGVYGAEYAVVRFLLHCHISVANAVGIGIGEPGSGVDGRLGVAVMGLPPCHT
jgi:hypothetical protein